MNDQYATMSIASFGPATLPKKEKLVTATRDINNIDDIDGAKRVNRLEKFVNKPDFFRMDDVDGSKSKILHPHKNVPNFYEVDDIDGARHFIKDRMLTTKRHTNPLIPDYDMPRFQQPDPYTPKFIRNTLDISDIDGAAPKPVKHWQPRESLKTDDIEGAQACWRPRHR